MTRAKERGPVALLGALMKRGLRHDCLEVAAALCLELDHSAAERGPI